MLRGQELVVRSVINDSLMPGRQVESLIQHYKGIPVYGSSLSRQIENGVTISVVGTVRTVTDLDPEPRLSVEQAVSKLREVSGSTVMGGTSPKLVIYPLPDGRSALAYEAVTSTATIYLIDAHAGDVLLEADARHSQSQVGSGMGTLGDLKKLSTTRAAGAFRTHDQLRPAPVLTFDTRGSENTLGRILISRQVVDADFPADSDNEWSNAPVVDVHVHTGWTEDFLYKQFNWTGVSNSGQPITAVFDASTANNAFFIGPPFGPDALGAFVFGRASSSGAPIAALDVVAHELMHGVTTAAVSARTGAGVLPALHSDRLGPNSFTFNGQTFPCAQTTFGGRPAHCIDGRYVMVSNHPGAIHEAFSDVVGTAVEAAFHARGDGPLRADYKMGEDIAGFGPNRALDVPQSIAAASTAAGPLPYPDHLSRVFSYILVIVSGSRANPTSFGIVPFLILGDRAVQVPGTDDGGVHINATVLGHAFYLAVEGGRNATSGLSVQGVGNANRAHVERAFFRAMTMYMPKVPSLQIAALATYQSSVDLYGAGSPTAQAVDQALRAVGLR